MRYFADFSANNGSTSNSKSYEFTSLSEAKKTIKEIVKGNHFQQTGNISRCDVRNEEGETVWAGYMSGTSTRVITVDNR